MITKNQTSSLWKSSSLKAVIELVNSKYGINLSCFEESFLIKSLEKRRQLSTNSNTPDSYIERLATDYSEAIELSRSMQICYSEFFRDPLSFALLRQLILPSLVEKRTLDKNSNNELRCWSSGCATGQEVWSLAILLDDMIIHHDKKIPFRIFGTDLSEENLSIARIATYSEDSVGKVCLNYIRKYFIEKGDAFTVIPRLSKNADFSTYDLMDKKTGCPEASIYGNFDLVLCCNVLIYYSTKAKRFILNKLINSIADGGYLVVGESERLLLRGVNGLKAVTFPAPVFQKLGKSKK